MRIGSCTIGRVLGATAWGLLLAGWPARGDTPVDPRPNILFIMSDDHAAHAVSAYGSRVNTTPHIDRLGREGMRMDRMFAVNSICTPSRATLLTGQYSHVNGVPVFNAFDGSRPHVAKMLRGAGYQTAMIGKWHLGSDPTGFEYWQILPGQGAYFDPVLYGSDGERTYPGYVTEVITDLVVQWLERRDPDRPFFLLAHHKAPHRNWQPHPRHAAEWAKRSIPEPATLFDDYAGRSRALREQRQSVARDLTPQDLKQDPPDGMSGEARVRWMYQRYLQDYLACVEGVDESVGRLLEWIDRHGLRERTVVIYTSDQGFFLGDHGLYDKRFMYEESIRMPCLVRWPEVIRPGTVSDALAINCDFAPTFLALAGLPASADMQGRSLVPLWRGDRPADWRRAFYYRYYHDPGHHNTRAHLGVRTERYKLIHFWTLDEWECYDLARDPGELHNLYADPAAQPIVAELKAELARLQREVGDTANRFADPSSWPASTADVGPPSARSAR